MQTLVKQVHIISIVLFLFSFVGCTQVPSKDTTTKKNTDVNLSNDMDRIPTEAGDGIATKSNTIEPCISKLEENEVKVLMDTITSNIHVDFYCLCSDYLTDVKVKLSNKEQIYERITDKLGCDFRHIQSGKYLLEVDYEAAKKFKPVEVMVMSGAESRWKIFLCEE
jgi:serine/threonine protein phosphatase PrpC